MHNGAYLIAYVCDVISADFRVIKIYTHHRHHHKPCV